VKWAVDQENAREQLVEWVVFMIRGLVVKDSVEE